MAAPFRFGQELDVTIDSLATGGRGVARHDGVVVFVDRALPGDRVRARVTKIKRRHAEAVTIERLESGPGRIDAPCAHFGACGGCRWQDLTYDLQLGHKSQQVADAIQRIGGFENFALEPIEPAVEQFRYRNKMEYAWTDTPAGPSLGFHRAGRWEEVIALDECLIASERGNAVRRAFVQWAREVGHLAWDQRANTGQLRHLVVREGRRSGQILCVLVTGAIELKKVERLEQLVSAPELGVVGVLHAINDGVAETTQGIPAVKLFGRVQFEEELGGLTLSVSAGAFLQTNTEMADVLYRDAIAQAALTGDEIVWDLYCGTGSIGLALAGSARRVIGIEIVEEAVDRARENALANGIGNATFVCADASKAPRDLIADGIPKPDVVVLDPPRAGITPKALRRVLELQVPRIVYVSCNPTTLAGNAQVICEDGYTLERVKPFDLFPHTPHVECVATFSKASF